jgi:DNA-binding response OmpR family regulator
MHVLVVENEEKFASFIQRGLEAEHYSVDLSYDGEAGLTQFFDGDYDLLILDVMLPKRDGLSMLREVRKRGVQIPVLLNGARYVGRCRGLDQADDYLTKPFAFEELLARVRALLRRGAPTHRSPYSGGPESRSDNA